jgi:hypothetical protein
MSDGKIMAKPMWEDIDLQMRIGKRMTQVLEMHILAYQEGYDGLDLDNLVALIQMHYKKDTRSSDLSGARKNLVDLGYLIKIGDTISLRGRKQGVYGVTNRIMEVMNR